MFQLRLCGGKPLVAVARDRRYGPSRLRVNGDDDDTHMCIRHTAIQRSNSRVFLSCCPCVVTVVSFTFTAFHPRSTDHRSSVAAVPLCSDRGATWWMQLKRNASLCCSSRYFCLSVGLTLRVFLSRY